MDMIKKASLAVGLSTLLSACGGGGTGGGQEVAALWETYVEPATATPAFTVTHRDLALDSFGDLITLGNAGIDSDPTTPKMDVKHHIVIAKQDQNGNQIWQSLLDYPADRFSTYQVESDDNGNLFIVGDGFIMATDSNGQLLWQDTFEGLGLSVTIANGLVYVPARITRIYDLNGNLQSTIDNGGIYPWEVHVTANGSVIQATNNAITRHDFMGNLEWSVTAPTDVTTLARVQLDSSENVYVSYLSNGGSSAGDVAAARVLKIDAQGNQQWNRFIPDNRPSSNYYKAGSVFLFLANNGDVVNVTAGTKGRQITKLNNANGQVILEKTHSGQGEVNDAELTNDGKLILVGSSNPQQYDLNGNLLSTGDMAYTITRNTLAVGGNRYFVGGNVMEDAAGNDLKALYTAAFAK